MCNACTTAVHAPPRPSLELADIVRAHGKAYRAAHVLTSAQSAVLRDIERCRTAVLGGHVLVCQDCGHRGDPSYNSCRNRHCPKCQSAAAFKWVEARTERVLPTHYFHVVFTLPAELRGLAMRNRRLVFDLLFAAASATLLEFAKDPQRLGGRLGMTMVLHTWARDLSFHPHIHVIVTGGGLSPDGERWVALPENYLFPLEPLRALFRGKFLAGLSEAHAQGKLDLGEEPVDPQGFDRLRSKLYAMSWHLYAKRPFGGPEQVIKYLGRYTHRVGISNSRLETMSETGQVTFRTKNGDKVTLAAEVFLGRFLQHVLPERFVKIRHYGLLAPANVNTKLVAARALLEATAQVRSVSNIPSGPSDADTASPGVLPTKACPACGSQRLRREPIPKATTETQTRRPP